MPIKDLKKWLATECPKSEIKYLDEENKKGAYIPIGIVEQNLDELDSWDTEAFSFMMIRADKGWVASGSIKLIVRHGDVTITRHGAATFPIQTKSVNDDYEATALSHAISNAAKKLGKRFGRHLNGRLDIGEALPTIDFEAQRKLDAAIDEVNLAKNEEEIKVLYDKFHEYQKDREFILAVSNRKQLLKIENDKQHE